MTEPWAPERVVDPELAQSLISRQFPDLVPVRVEPFGEGWDNTAYRVNGTRVFRFPRRQVAAPLIETELEILPRIAPRLPLAVPNPAWAGRPDARYPWRFAGYAILPGRTADRAALTDEQRTILAGPLARFLAALHSLPAEGVGPDRIGRLDVQRLTARIGKFLDAEGGDSRPARSLVEAAAGLRPSGRRSLVHGDLYARHLLVGDEGRLTGIIDWGDVHYGDPAVDLSVAWSFLPAAARPVFLEAYGPVDEADWGLARLRALHYGAVLTEYGRGAGDPVLTREGAGILRRVCEQATSSGNRTRPSSSTSRP